MKLRAACAAAPLGAVALLLPGCLESPPLDQRWTLLELANGPDVTTVTPGSPGQIALTARITYRKLLTGFVIAEVRASDTLGPQDVTFTPHEDALTRARDVDRIIAQSTSLGFASRAVTGFDHLIQEIPLTIDAGLPPPSAGGAVADSVARAGVHPAKGLFLLVYFGNVDEVEMDDGSRVDVVTPFPSEGNEILSTGISIDQGS